MAMDIDFRQRDGRMFGEIADSAGMPKANLIRRVWRSLMDELVQSVPEEDSVCEFGCRKQQCTVGEWSTCERRLQAVAAQLRFSGRPEPSESQVDLGPAWHIEPDPSCPSPAPSSPDCALEPVLR